MQIEPNREQFLFVSFYWPTEKKWSIIIGWLKINCPAVFKNHISFCKTKKTLLFCSDILSVYFTLLNILFIIKSVWFSQTNAFAVQRAVTLVTRQTIKDTESSKEPTREILSKLPNDISARQSPA